MQMPAQSLHMGTTATSVLARRVTCLLVCRLQVLSGLATANAHEATSAATLRLQEIAEEEPRVQGAIVVKLSCELWEPLQTVSIGCIV